MTALPAIADDLITTRLDDEIVVMTRSDQQVLRLHPAAALVFTHCQAGTPRDDLAAQIGEDQLQIALHELEAGGLLAGTTRRQLLTRGALLGSGLAAAGLITTVRAPAASAATSPGGGTPPGGGTGPTPGLVYTNPFDTTVQASGGTIALPSPGNSQGGSPAISNNGAASYLGNLSGAALTLTVPQSALGGTRYRIEVLFYAIASWDGTGPAGGNSGGNPDSFKISDNNGATMLNASFTNFGGDLNQGFPTAPLNPNQGGNAPKSGNTGLGVLGYGTGDFGDTQYTLSFTEPLDTSKDLVITFADTLNQGYGDEYWGLRNLTVTTLA